MYLCRGLAFFHSFTLLYNKDTFWLIFRCEGPWLISFSGRFGTIMYFYFFWRQNILHLVHRKGSCKENIKTSWSRPITGIKMFPKTSFKLGKYLGKWHFSNVEKLFLKSNLCPWPAKYYCVPIWNTYAFCLYIVLRCAALKKAIFCSEKMKSTCCSCIWWLPWYLQRRHAWQVHQEEAV